MEKGISEIVGRADLDEGRSTDLYRALRTLLCSTCGAEIAEGTLFTRRKVKGIGVRIMPQCQQCEPFKLSVDKEKESSLLRSLLSGQPTRARSGRRLSSEEASQMDAKAKTIEDEVRRRLEPALKRGRRGNR